MAIIGAWPAVEPAVKVALQLAVPTGLVPWARVQGDVLPKVAPGRPLFIEKLTVPAGVVAVPVLLSTTVATQVEIPPKLTVEGAHETVVVVVLRGEG